MELKEKTNLKTFLKQKGQHNKINITCTKLKNDLKWFTSSENIYHEPFVNEEKAIIGLVENWWVNS
ncbi:MAG TPA: hypothetical protein VKG26_02345 [Bacteroidia bacterium]|nr:hypothetical protein [Bacteroidia bacterium]